eukprot:Clim_evm29s225 gene=Clim_evmTU29s225
MLVHGILRCSWPVFARRSAPLMAARPFLLRSLTRGITTGKKLGVEAVAGGATIANSRIQTAAAPAVGKWLLGVSGLVVGSVVLGGITRLTESGLSMTTWNLIREMKPPRTQAEWEEEFAKYQASPEYKYVHSHFTLSEFKRIFYMEWGHRMWGRLIGLSYILPASYFWARGKIPQSYKLPIFGIGALICGQGLMGWYMVKSGLTYDEATQKDVPRVSQYRLAAHLGLAFVIYACSLLTSLSMLSPPGAAKAEVIKSAMKLSPVASGLAGLIFATSMSGAFVAGLDAGLLYNSFPKMADCWVPDDILAMNPTWKNFTENPTTVQFDHRVLGITTFAACVAMTAVSRTATLTPRARMIGALIGGMATAQASLGIATLLYYVPTPLAATHQVGSITLLSLALWFAHEIRRLGLSKPIAVVV